MSDDPTGWLHKHLETVLTPTRPSRYAGSRFAPADATGTSRERPATLAENARGLYAELNARTAQLGQAQTIAGAAGGVAHGLGWMVDQAGKILAPRSGAIVGNAKVGDIHYDDKRSTLGQAMRPGFTSGANALNTMGTDAADKIAGPARTAADSANRELGENVGNIALGEGMALAPKALRFAARNAPELANEIGAVGDVGKLTRAPSPVLRPAPSAKRAFSEVPAERFGSALQEFKAANPDGARFHTWRTPAEMQAEGMKTFLSPDGKTGYALAPDGDIRNVFNIGAKGRGAHAMADAIERGGRKLDAFDAGLGDFYTDFGFKRVGKDAFDPQYAPEGWDYAKHGRPDITYMQLAPGDNLPAEARLARAANARAARKAPLPGPAVSTRPPSLARPGRMAPTSVEDTGWNAAHADAGAARPSMEIGTGTGPDAELPRLTARYKELLDSRQKNGWPAHNSPEEAEFSQLGNEITKRKRAEVLRQHADPDLPAKLRGMSDDEITRWDLADRNRRPTMAEMDDPDYSARKQARSYQVADERIRRRDAHPQREHIDAIHGKSEELSVHAQNIRESAKSGNVEPHVGQTYQTLMQHAKFLGDVGMKIEAGEVLSPAEQALKDRLMAFSFDKPAPQIGSGPTRIAATRPPVIPGPGTFEPTSRGIFDRRAPNIQGTAAVDPRLTTSTSKVEPSELAQAIGNSKVVERGLQADTERGLPLGGNTWYEGGPIKQSFDEMGGPFSFHDFNLARGSASIQSPTHLEIPTATGLLFGRRNGLNSMREIKAAHAEMYPTEAKLWGTEGTHTNYQRAVGNDAHIPPTPGSGDLKLPGYSQGNEGGVLDGGIAALDKHERRREMQLGWEDPKIRKLLKSLGFDETTATGTRAEMAPIVNRADYLALNSPYQRIAQRMGLPSVQAGQAGRWIGGAKHTGLMSQPVGDAAQTIEDVVLHTARTRGLPTDAKSLRSLWQRLSQGQDIAAPIYGKDPLSYLYR